MGGCCICFALVLCMHYLPARLWHSMCVWCGGCARARVCKRMCICMCAGLRIFVLTGFSHPMCCVCVVGAQ